MPDRRDDLWARQPAQPKSVRRLPPGGANRTDASGVTAQAALSIGVADVVGRAVGLDDPAHVVPGVVHPGGPLVDPDLELFGRLLAALTQVMGSLLQGRRPRRAVHRRADAEHPPAGHGGRPRPAQQLAGGAIEDHVADRSPRRVTELADRGICHVDSKCTTVSWVS